MGIEFHRIGSDLIHALLENCRASLYPLEIEGEVDRPPPERAVYTERAVKLETAAFHRAQEKVRSTSWTVDELWDEEPEAPIIKTTPPAAGETPAPAQEETEEQANPSSKHPDHPPSRLKKEKKPNSPGPSSLLTRKYLFNLSMKRRSIRHQSSRASTRGQL